MCGAWGGWWPGCLDIVDRPSNGGDQESSICGYCALNIVSAPLPRAQIMMISRYLDMEQNTTTFVSSIFISKMFHTN